MLPYIADGLTSGQRTLFNTVKLLTDADMLNASGIVKVAYVVGCAINRQIDVDVPYAEVVDYATKHPLGDVCYDEIIRLAAEWRLPYPMLGYHGNFGSLQGDCPAYMLYTSINLSDFAKDVVEPYDNLDNKKIACQEFSRVLPYKIPILLINGYVNEPYVLFVPHNIAEVCDAVLAYLVNPKISIKKLMAYIKGPDFPTGGMIVHRPEKVDTEKIFPKVDISQIALRQRTGTPLLYKFRFCGQLSFFKRIFAFNLAFIIAFSVVRRGVISDGKARPPFIVEPDISFHNFLEVLFSPASLYSKVDCQFFFYPAVQSLIHGIVGGLSCP